MRFQLPLRATRWLAFVVCLAAASPVSADDSPADDPVLRAQVEELIRQNREMQRRIRALENDVQSARDEAAAARSRATRAEETSARALAPVGAPPESPTGPEGPALFSRQAGPVSLQLLDISLDTLLAFGWSSERDAALEQLQGGEHDPRRRGFNLQQVELGLQGAVDPFFTADAFLVYFLDTDGESRFELEEAFVTSMMLPFGLEEYGFQIEAGHFFTEYGRINPQHPHEWAWQDQPVINTRLFGPDGARNPGLRLGWLTPLPWYSELMLGLQNAFGETMSSFLSSDEVAEEAGGGIGGRPFVDVDVGGLSKLAWLARWVNGFDISEEVSAQWGVSGLFGPNSSGNDGRSYLAGTDLVVKWLPLTANRGWPSLTWQTEFSYRWYQAEEFLASNGIIPAETLRDWGLYTQLLWGFRRGWDLGLRYEYAGGSGANVAFDEEDETFSFVSRQTDPLRDDRHRISPLLAFWPSEFSRLRLQYNYDIARHLDSDDAHTVWFGLEFLFGSHPAHAY